MLDFFKNYEGKSVLITGHTGFKGSWLTAWLKLLGAEITGVALNPPTEPSHFELININSMVADHRVNIDDKQEISKIFKKTKPDYVFHLAAQSLVGQAYASPAETWKTNLLGTVNILECLRETKAPSTAIIITSDKCYDNVEWVWGYRETDKLGGQDPYSASKAAAEIAFQSYAKTYFNDTKNVKIASARAGNVIGGGDWASGRLIPDCMRSWSTGKSAEIRNPMATRPWQHVLEPLSGYLQLAARLNEDCQLHGESFNFGPSGSGAESVKDLVEEMSQYWEDVQFKETIPKTKKFYEAKLLQLNCEKAHHYLDWSSSLNFKQTAQFTADWYKEFYKGNPSMLKVTLNQIKRYIQIEKEKGSS